MNGFPFIWLLFYTDIGKVILGLFVVFIIVSILGWWLIPVIATIIALILFYGYYTQKKFLESYVDITEEAREKYKQKNQGYLVVAILLMVIALVFVVCWKYNDLREKNKDDVPQYYESSKIVDNTDSKTYEPENGANQEKDKSKPVKSGPSSSSITKSNSSRNYSYDEEEDDYDNMRGFDPASEDDMDDNGMSRYMENNDEEGWD